MNKKTWILHLANYFIQSLVTGIVLCGIYMLFVILDYPGGFDAFVGTIVFQPIMSILFAAITIVICSIVGLPLRINRTLHNWWRKRPYLQFGMVALGLSCLILSILPFAREVVTVSEGDFEFEKEIPNGIALLTGWFLIAFSLVHSYLIPRRITERWSKSDSVKN